MRIYLIGPETPDLVASKWLLKECGYMVTCSADVRSKEYAREGEAPTERVARNRQLYEMQSADAVVLSEEVMDDAAAVLHILHVCRFGGLAAMRYDELPAQAPSLCRRDEIIAERDLVRPEAEPVGKRLRVQLRDALRRMDGWAKRFDARWAWFFTNGNKQRVPVEYVNDVKPLTTA